MTEEITLGVTVGVTKNLGDYNNIKLSAHKTITIPADQDEDEAWIELWGKVEDEVNAKLQQVDGEE